MYLFIFIVNRYSSRTHIHDLSHVNINLPEYYNFFEEYPECDFRNYTQECGNCYAHSAINMISHRFCRETHQQIFLSPQYVVACDFLNAGCFGGNERIVLTNLEHIGATNISCHPWTNTTHYSYNYCHKCSTNEQFKIYKIQRNSIQHYIGVENIKKAIYTQGPVSSCLVCDETFHHYQSGIFKSGIPYLDLQTEYYVNHSIELVGWGKEGDTEYWILHNQFGTNWGENGNMKIQMHSNEGFIEDYCYGALPLIE